MVAVLRMFSTIFCAVPAFMRVLPVMTSGPGTASMATVASSAMGEPGAHTMATSTGAGLLCISHRADRVGRAPTGGDADDDVAAFETVGQQVDLALFGVVFGRLDGMAQCVVAAGDKRDHAAGRQPERRQQLGSVQNAEAAAGAGADVEDAVAAAKASVTRSTARAISGQRFCHGKRRLRVLAIDEAADGLGGQLVDVLCSGVSLFREGKGRCVSWRAPMELAVSSARVDGPVNLTEIGRRVGKS